MRTVLRSKLTLLFLACAVAIFAVAGAAMALTTDTSGTASPSPTIQSDQADYAPGSTVNLTGSGWQPGESVRIVVNDDQGNTWSRTQDVTADDGGNISDSFSLPEYFVATYSVTATGASGTAVSSFTDEPFLNTLRLGSASGDVRVQFTAGDTIVADPNTNKAVSGRFYQYTVLDPSNTVKDTSLCLTKAQLDDATPESYTVKANDPISTSSSWTYRMREYSANSCSNTSLQGTDTRAFWVAKATAYSDPALTTPASTFGANATAYVKVEGMAPGTSSLSTTWLLPNGSVACQNTAGGSDRPGSSAAGRLPATSFLQYRPDNGATDIWNKASSYDTTPACPAFGSGNQGNWKLRLSGGSGQEVTVDLPVFSVSAPSNRAPVTTNDTLTTDEDTAGTVNVLANDSDPDGDTLTVTGNTNPAHGAVSLSGGTFTYTPAAHYNGTDSFTYTVSDGKGGTATGTVNVTVAPVNDAPTAGNGSATMAEDGTPITINLGALASDVETSSANLTYNVVQAPSAQQGTLSGTGSTRTFTPAADYNGSFDVLYTVTDRGDPDNCGAVGPNCAAAKTSAQGKVTVTVTPVNDAPSVGNITGDTTANEGQSKPYAVTATDVDGDTLTYAWTVKSGAATITGGAATATATVKFLDGPDSVNLQVVVDDGNGAKVTKNLDGGPIAVANVAPTANLSGPATADEGATEHYTYTVSDPGDDTFTVSNGYPSCGQYGNVVAGSATTTATGGSFDCLFTDGPNNTDVAIKVADSDGASDTDSESVKVVAVVNVDPTVTAPADQTANEGSSVAFNLGSFSDPGADSPWAVDVDWGDSSAHGTASKTAAGSLGTMNHTYADNGNYTVTVKVTDKNGGFDSKTFQVAVNNVAPTATKSFDTSVTEGSSFNLALTNPLDPSSADTTAGFQYRFDCGAGGGYGAWGTASSASCPTNDNGTRSVKAEIRDKDGDSNEYTGTVNVSNANPVLGALSLSGNTGAACLSGNTVGLSFSFSDVGSGDTHSGTIDWGDNSANTTFTSSPQNNVQHTYANAGTYTIKVTVTDDDGASDNKTAQVSKLYNMSAIQAPLNADGTSVFKSGSTIPVKVKITDCLGNPVGGLAPTIKTQLASNATPIDGVNEPISTSAADSTGVMRYDSSAGQYIYNMASKSVGSDQDAKYRVLVQDAKSQFSATQAYAAQVFGLRTK